MQGLTSFNPPTYVQCPWLGGANPGGSQDGIITVHISEGFSASFKPRTFAQDSKYPGSTATIANPLPPSVVTFQNVLGYPYDTESGFISAAAGLSNPGLGNGAIGLADTGTQFQAAITNVGSGVHIFAPNRVYLSSTFPGVQTTGVVCLVGSDCTGNQTELSVIAGVATATYEVWLADPNTNDSAAIAFQVTDTGSVQPGTGISQVVVSFAPLGSVHITSTSDPMPRFVNTSAVQAVSITSCPVPGDFDGNRAPDLVWQHNDAREVTVWYMGGTTGNTFLGWNWLYDQLLGEQGWSVVAIADVNQDGHPDLIRQHHDTRRVELWYMGGASGDYVLGVNEPDRVAPLGWTVVAAADMNQNGHPDLIWQNDATRQVTVWYMGGMFGSTFLGWNWLDAKGQPGWSVVAAADVNQDGHPDLIWQNDNTRQIVVWYMGGAMGNTFLGWNWLDAQGHPGWKVVGL